MYTGPMNRLRELRKAADLTQHELSMRTGIPATDISRLETAETLSCLPRRLRALSEALGVSVDALLATGQPEAPQR